MKETHNNRENRITEGQRELLRKLVPLIMENTKEFSDYINVCNSLVLCLVTEAFVGEDFYGKVLGGEAISIDREENRKIIYKYELIIEEHKEKH